MIENTRITIVRGGYYRCTPEWSRAKGEYTFERIFGYLLPVSGEASMETSGGVHILKPGGVYFISGHQLLAQTCKREMCVYWVSFGTESFYLHHRLMGIPGGIYRLPLESVPGAEPVFLRFAESFEEPTPEISPRFKPNDSRMREDSATGLAVQIEGTVMCLTGKLIEATEKDFRWEDYTDLERLKPAIDFMDENYLANPMVAEIARRIRLAPNYFHRLFKQRIGQTPFKYMENRRLDLARKLLFDPRLNITEVAQQSGYESLYYFSRAFRRRFGQSPSQLRATR